MSLFVLVVIGVCGCADRGAPPLASAPPTEPSRPVADDRRFLPVEQPARLPRVEQPPERKERPAEDTDKAYTFYEIRLNKGYTSGIAFSADVKQLVVAGEGDIRVWTVPEGKEVIQMQLPDKNLVLVAFANDGKHLISVSPTDHKIRFWSLTTGKQVKELDLPRAKDVQWVVGFSPDTKHLAVKVTDGLYLADPLTGKVTVEFAGACPGDAGHARSRGAFSHDGKRFAAGAGKGSIAVWDITTGKQLTANPGTGRDWPSEFTHVAFSPDDRWIATSAFDVGASIRIWDAATTEKLCELKVNGSFTTCLAWTPDGTAVISNGNFAASAFDVATGKTTHQFKQFGREDGWNATVQGTTPDRKYIVFTAFSSVIHTDRPTQQGWSIYLCRAPEPKKLTPPKAELTATELDALWADVTTPNKIRQEQIRTALTAAAPSAVPYLAKKVPVASADDMKAISKSIAELDADAPAVRKAAQDRLSLVAHRFEIGLREALTDAPAGEVRNRLTFLLGEVKEKPLPADLQAELRAVEILAGLKAAEARKALESLAGGSPQSRVTRQAKSSLDVLDRKP